MKVYGCNGPMFLCCCSLKKQCINRYRVHLFLFIYLYLHMHTDEVRIVLNYYAWNLFISKSIASRKNFDLKKIRMFDSWKNLLWVSISSSVSYVHITVQFKARKNQLNIYNWPLKNYFIYKQLTFIFRIYNRQCLTILVYLGSLLM